MTIKEWLEMNRLSFRNSNAVKYLIVEPFITRRDYEEARDCDKLVISVVIGIHRVVFKTY